MKSRFVVLLLALVLGSPGVLAQTAAPRSQEAPPPQAEVLARAIRAISTMHMEAFDDSTLWESAIDGLIESLNDPYAALFTPRESEAWEEETTGNYSGIGLQITPLNERVTVTAVFRGTPADEAGILVGDVIVGVNEHDATHWTTDMAADSIRGPVGTPVTVRIRRQGFDEPISFEIIRAQVHVPAVHYGVLPTNVGYVMMDRVARNAAREMNRALGELQRTRGIIIDLRRNPGGFLDESLMLADLFLKPGSTLASTVQRVPGGAPGEMEEDSFTDRWPQLVPDLPIVILVDRFTASGAEILAGALQDYDRALIIGERTFGKGVVQSVLDLPYGRKLRFTTGAWHTPLGRSLQRPRDAQGRPLAEDPDTFPTVITPGGRELVSGGGIFPDLEVADDTLRAGERRLIQEVNEKQVPLGLRLAELGFELARARRAENATPGVRDAEFETFLQQLADEGISAETLADPTVREYLHWRARIAVAQRMDDLGREAYFRMERDPVLAEAARLLGTAITQAELFEAAGTPLSHTGAPAGAGGR